MAIRYAMAAVLLVIQVISGVGSAASADPGTSASVAEEASEKRRLVADYLGLTPAQAAGFWPLYGRLQGELQLLQRNREEHIGNYGRDYASMTDALALAYTKERLRHEELRLRLLREYLPRFQKVLPARKLARYYQIEDRINAAIAAEAAAEIPLIQ